jgi:hypothetical protein
MPIVATPSTPVVLLEDEVRRFMRDYPDRNILLEDVEFSQEDVNQALRMVTSAYNSTTPITSITPDSWPYGQEYLMLLGVAWYLIMSGTFLQLRNQATYQDGDIAPIGIDDKFPLYMALWQSLKQTWDEMVKTTKTQLNLESSYGTLSSGYLNVARFHHT